MALVRIQVRRDPAATWASTNPVLAAGEPGLETDTGKIKYGDGVRAWNSLPYSSGVGLGSAVPPAAGTAAVGTSQDAARADHSHAMPTNIQAQTVSSTGSATVGGNLTVQGQLVGGTHRHQAADINDLAAAVFSRIVSSIKAGDNIQATVDANAQTITLSSTTAGSSPLVITLHPVDFVATGSTATFSAAASGGSAVVEYEWQVSTDGGQNWSAVPGASGTSLALSGVTGAMDGNRYRLKAASGAEAIFSNYATLTAAQVAIIAQPPDAAVSVGETVRLSVEAAAGSSAISYRWQRRATSTAAWVDVPEATLPVYSFTPSDVTDSAGTQFQAIATAGGQSASSRIATVVVRAAPLTFLSQPQDTQDTAGAATFTADGAGGTQPVVYRWQRIGGGSATWSASGDFADIPDGTSNVSGQATETLSLTGQTAAQHLRRYRLRAIDADGRTAFSAPATLRTLSLQITEGPSDVSATSGDTLAAGAFSVTATADGGVTYQWQRSTDRGATWTNISGATSASYGGITVTFVDDGNLYRCAVTGDGQTLNTNSAALAVAPPALTISTQPSNVTATGSSATFSFAHTGGPSVTAQVYWESRTAGSGWTRVPGATSTTLNVTGITPANDGTAYRGVVQRGAATAFTNPATLTAPGAIIFLQPQNATSVSGAASFSVDFTSVSCSSPTILWEQRVNSGASWSNAPGTNNAKTLSLSSLTTAANGYQYRATVTCGGRASFSDVATLTVPVPPVVITTQPSDAVAASGQATFSFAHAGGDGSAPTIRWERVLPGGSFATVPGATSNTLAVSGITTSMSGAQYRATVTIGTQSATTRSAVLTVAGASITLNPADAIAVEGAATFTFDFSSSCSEPFIQWEKKPAANTVWTPIQGANSRTLTLTGLIPADTNHNYRAGVDCAGVTSYSSSASLTVPSYEFFTTQPASQAVNAGDEVTFSYQGRFPASQFTARWYMRRIGSAAWSRVTPRGQSQQSYTFVANVRAHHNTEWRVEINTLSGPIYSAIARLTVDKKTSTKYVATAGTSDLVGIAYGKGAFVALTSDQTSLVRRSEDGGDTWTTHFLPASRYWDGVTASQSGALFAYGSGESGVRSGNTWKPDTRYPTRTGTIARSVDGGKTWSQLALPFFVGNSLRMWGTNYNNTVLAFFYGETVSSVGSQFSPAAYSWYVAGHLCRQGAYWMAVTTNDGATWALYPLRAFTQDEQGRDVVGGSPLVPQQVAISPSGLMVIATRRVNAASGSERPGKLFYRNIAAGWGEPTPAATATVGIANRNGNASRVIATGGVRGGVLPDVDTQRNYRRSAATGSGFNAGMAITNHHANSVEWVPGAGFIAVHDRYPVAMISQDGNLWGAVPTDRICGEVPLHVVGNALYGIDTTLPRYEWVTAATAATYPDFQNLDLGITDITDTVNCWAHSPSEVMLLESGGAITWIPRDDAPNSAPSQPADENAPTDIAVESSNRSATITWGPPDNASTSPPQRYDVEYTSDGGRTWTMHTAPASAALTRTVTGLTTGTTYYFRVSAVSSAGAAAYSEWSPPVTPAPTIPGPPSNLTVGWQNIVVPGQARQIVARWSPPSGDGGSPITSYTLQTNDGLITIATGISASRGAVSFSSTALRSRRGGAVGATFRVFAVNSAGNGVSSASSNPLPPPPT